MKKITIGVMGPGRNATPEDISNASIIGRGIAEEGWVLLSGGKNEELWMQSIRLLNK